VDKPRKLSTSSCGGWAENDLFHIFCGKPREVFQTFPRGFGQIILSAYGNLEISTNYSNFRCAKLLLFHTVFHKLWKTGQISEGGAG
jgi:hypothetical protein